MAVYNPTHRFTGGNARSIEYELRKISQSIGDIPIGDITAVTAGNGLSGGGASGDVTLALDINELSVATVATGDYVAIEDITDNGSKKVTAQSIADLAPQGDITGVTAGTNLNGGGTSGAVTLNLDTNITGDITFDTNVLAVDATNNRVGIGTASPSALLHLVGGAFAANITVGGDDIQAAQVIGSTSMRGGVLVYNLNDFRNTSTKASFMHYDPYDAALTTDAYAFRAMAGASLVDTFWVSGTGKAYFKGNVGIGTTSPAYKLEVASGDGAVQIGPNASYSRDLWLGGWGTGTGECWVRASNGNLHLDSKDGYHTYLNYYTTGNVFIAGGGKLGIGNTSPSYKLDVTGDGRFTTNLTVTGTTYCRYLKATDNTALYFGLLDSWQMKVTDGVFSPYTNADVALGSASLQWAGGRFSTWLRVYGAAGLYFQDYGGGFYMVDSTWIRTYGSKNFYHNTGVMRTDGDFHVADLGARFLVNGAGNVSCGEATVHSYATWGTPKLQVNGPIHLKNWSGTPASSAEVLDWPHSLLHITTKSNYPWARLQSWGYSNDAPYATSFDNMWNLAIYQNSTNNITSSNSNTDLKFAGPGAFAVRAGGQERFKIESTGDITLESNNNVHRGIKRVGGIYFTWDSDSYGWHDNHSIRSTDGDTWSDDITINSYGNVRVNIDTNNNGANTFTIGHSNTALANTVLTVDEGGSLTTTGNHYINNGSPTIYFRDTNHRSCMFHNNSNLLYILRGSGNNSTTWAQVNGMWPAYWNLENNDMIAGGGIHAQYGLGLGTGSPINNTDLHHQTIQIATDTYYGGTYDLHSGFRIHTQLNAGGWASPSIHFKGANGWGSYDKMWLVVGNWTLAGAHLQSPLVYDRYGTSGSYLRTDGSGNIFRLSSSGRYKTDVEDLWDAEADKLLSLRPVWFRSVAPIDRSDWAFEGFLAEEVAEINPRWVEYGQQWVTAAVTDSITGVTREDPVEDEDGNRTAVLNEDGTELLRPEGVQYPQMVPALVNLIRRQKTQIQGLTDRVGALEAA